MKILISITLCVMTLLFLNQSAAFAAERGKSASRSSATQPFTYANVVSYFKSAELRATEVQKRCTIFFEGEWRSANIYAYCLIIVENSDEDIQVTFYLTDAHEMNWVTEFFDAPFFAQSETQKLFGLLNAGRDIRRQKIGRFSVDFHHWQPRHAEILVFSFTPLRTSSN
jgi:hypothetical protein